MIIRRIPAFILAVLALVSCHDAQAQRVWTLDSAIGIAMRHAPAIRSAELNSSLSDLARREAGLASSPALRYKLGASYAPTGRYFGYDPALTNEGQLNAQLSVDAPLYNGGLFGLKQRQANLDVLHSQTALDFSRENLRFEVTQAFLNDLRANRTITLERESLRDLASYRDLVDRLFHGGTSSYTDLLKTEVLLGQEQIAYDKAAADEVAARYALASLLGNPTDTLFALRGAIDSISSESPLLFPYKDSLTTFSMALANNEIERAKLDLDIAQAQSKPTISATMDAGLLTSVGNLTGPADQRTGVLGASAGITVEGPILDWGLNKVQVQEKQVAVAILQSELERQRREIAAQLTQLQLQLRSSYDRLKRIRDVLKKAEDTYDLVKAKYAVGASLAAEVLDAFKQILDTKRSELDALSDIETSRANAIHLLAQPNQNGNNNGK